MRIGQHRPSVDEHAALMRSLLVFERRTETVALDEALGRITARAVTSPVDLPLFRNSQMDGFAVRASDIAAVPAKLPIVGEIPARPGQPAPLAPGTAVRIMTGAVVPDGADAVVPVEDTTVVDGVAVIETPRVVGEYVRDRGSDLRAGDELLPAATVLRSRHLAALAAAGIASVEVLAPVRVAVITTGAELAAPGVDPQPGQVYDANAIAIVSAVRAAGASVVISARVTDDHDTFRAALAAATDAADLVITSGGISMGDYEVVREVLEPLGATVTTIAMQPGGPQATAVIDGVPVISFPGNPVSTQISVEMFVAPVLRELAGLPAARRQSRVLDTDVRSVPGKRQLLRGRAVGEDGVTVVGGPSSHLVAGLAASDLLIDIPEATVQLRKGDTVETLAL
ncbi:molybdopterin molybdotransferase MoeA [Lacisediminihabitans changchengi]|uniref:Molybdopterin molybdenumtransferase n=1 Tax=Lacisediminihabitans changchengi TaxID=2787634 RepID=A0A934SJ79_9MICO|nr:gephyrin-like molybdotransferase Glp [Lacisediminihabitans changchengi]MBK4346359.1 molybdopterin molybdotransferase MoeA [Lacisediminihabitans changchengi]